MSTWRTSGFVQDSDEDEEDIEAPSAPLIASSQRVVERVEFHNTSNNSPVWDVEENVIRQGDNHDSSNAPCSFPSPDTPPRRTSPNPPTLSPITPIPEAHVEASPIQKIAHESTESLDPLQESPTPKTHRLRTLPSSQNPSFPTIYTSDTPNLEPQDASRHLNEFVLELLTDSGSELSDPPSDLETDPEQATVFASPHRRTAVQVLIPQSSVSKHSVSGPKYSRSFRTRKPIQIHPYILEGERYRREFQDRGIKPVLRVSSPPRKLAYHDVESQEKEFNPDDDSPSNTPSEIPLSTPNVRGSRKEVPPRDSAPRPGHNPMRRKSMSPQIRISHNGKRRKLDRPSTQVPLSTKTAQTTGILVEDIWNLPQSPPHSSSPLLQSTHPILRGFTRPLASTPVPDLPTPSNSSSTRDELQLLDESDSDPVVPSTHRSTQKSRRNVTVLSEISSTASIQSGSRHEASDTELQSVRKRIKGVLPASWIRIDRQAQGNRTLQAIQGRTSTQSPERTVPQRGIARKITRRIGNTRNPGLRSQREDVVVISDGSECEIEFVPQMRNGERLESAFQATPELAAILDHRYAGEDSDNMENDRLHLFTLGGFGKKRRRQTKLTYKLGNTKKMKLASDGPKRDGLSKYVGPRHARGEGPKNPKRSSPPALSILDCDITPARGRQPEPQFIRLARRRARQRLDHGRQSPKNKAIQLHTARDTEDATVTLRQWRDGTLKPRAHIERPGKTHQDRQPLADRMNSQQRTLPQFNDRSGRELDEAMPSRNITPEAWQPAKRPLGLQVFQRALTKPKPSQQDKRPLRYFGKPQQYIRLDAPPFRTAQLEGLEADFGRNHCSIAFQRGLQRVDQQFSDQSSFAQLSKNPQLARFLADGSDLLPLPSAEDIGGVPQTTSITPPRVPKRRLVRKVQARRIDVDAREYRQPSEPAVQNLFTDLDVQETELQGQEMEQHILQSLGTSDTRYPFNFDVTPLKVGTYFQSATFIGSGEFGRALAIGKANARDMDEPSGFYFIQHGKDAIKCGPWNDETHTRIASLVDAVCFARDGQARETDNIRVPLRGDLKDIASVLRSLIAYFSDKLSFSDSVDRTDFASRMKPLIETLLKNLLETLAKGMGSAAIHHNNYAIIQPMTYLLVLSFQMSQIARHSIVDKTIQVEFGSIVTSIAKALVTHLIRNGVSDLGDFLEKNKRYKERENGIQDGDVLAEAVVVCMHVLVCVDTPGLQFWYLVSLELSKRAEKATHLRVFESSWASIFTLLPFGEIDASGVLVVNRRMCLNNDSWIFIRDLLKQLFALYPNNFRKHGYSLDSYIRANLVRCHILIDQWHWRRCDPMLTVVFDFFGRNGLRQLQPETSRGPTKFLEHLTENPSLKIDPDECSFHIFLKCLALGLQGFQRTYTEKKIRSIVFRLTPNHGRSYPKDQSLDGESLDALRNHHDLLCTLYWASPPSCRPKIDLLRGLVQYESSHQAACRVNVRAWANLTAFQLSVDEPYASLEPFASWHQQIIQETLKQYRLAKSEVEKYLKFAEASGSSDISNLMVQQTMEQNQEQVIATVLDCITGAHKAIDHSASQSLSKDFLIQSDIVQLLELPHVQDPRLTVVIRNTLNALRHYVSLQKQSSAEVNQQSSEESQDYGAFPDLDEEELREIDQSATAPARKQSAFTFIETPLWHLLSNNFGADHAPDDSLLIDCVDTWVLIAGSHVTSGERSWSDYIDSFSQVSWRQLRDTEQTRKFSPYFLAALMASDPAAYKEHTQNFLTSLMASLVERDSMLRYQHLLLKACLDVDASHPLLQNLPFYRDEHIEPGGFDITADTVRTRRLSLISSILANMRQVLQSAMLQGRAKVLEAKNEYGAMLKEFMNAMRNNYQRLRQGTKVTGAYVEFVQRVVQFLTQYTSDICPVLPFFTDSVTFPLPTTDPKYVVGRLCGYAPKLSSVGVAKQLSVFIKTVTQQATADGHHQYLVGQLQTALCDGASSATDRSTLRDVLLQGIFPVYIETAFSSIAKFAVARPLLQSIRTLAETLLFDLRITDEANLRSICNTVFAISHAFIRSTECFKGDATLLHQPHILQATTLMLDAVEPFIPLLDYVSGRVTTITRKPDIVAYLEQFSNFIIERMDGMVSGSIPSYNGDAHAIPPQYSDLFSFSANDLKCSMDANWSESRERLFFLHGNAKREVIVDLGSMEEERAGLLNVIDRLNSTIGRVYGNTYMNRGRDDERAQSLVCNVDI